MLIEGMAALMKAAGLPNQTPSTLTITRILKAIGEKDAKLDEEVNRSLYELLFKTSEMVGDLNKRIDKARSYLSERRR